MFKREFDKMGGDTTEITFAFDRNTDMGPIQIADRFPYMCNRKRIVSI
jgi:hypothetical protein